MLKLGQRRSWAAHGDREIQRTIDEAVAEKAAQEATEGQERLAAYHEKVKPVPYTLAELKSARYVRTDVGWHKVVRVNAKSVTVETGYS